MERLKRIAATILFGIGLACLTFGVSGANPLTQELKADVESSWKCLACGCSGWDCDNYGNCDLIIKHGCGCQCYAGWIFCGCDL